MEIQFRPNSFLKNMEYSAYYPSIAKDFENRFPDLEKLSINLIERFPIEAVPSYNYSVDFSNSNKDCILTLYFDRWIRKGKLLPPPSPSEVLGHIKRMLEKIAHDYQLMKEEEAKPQRNDNEIISDIRIEWKKMNEFDYYRQSHTFLENMAKRILTLIKELQGTQNEELRIKALQAFNAASHTMGKELSFVAHHYEKTKKRNAPKIRMTEYHESIKEFIEQFYSDIVFLLIS